jgi:tRNA U55 pseudouridine synthase TruB
MDKVLNLYKLCGETPLECILRYKKEHPEFEGFSMTYAGRLDPLAEGVLLVLAGEAVHRKEEFLNLKKEYEVEVLFGVGTDTFDVLGIPLSSLRMRGELGRVSECKDGARRRESGPNKFLARNYVWSMDSRLHGNDNTDAENILKKFLGKNIFEYPPYSSKPVNGKPLFSIARSGELDNIEMPKREVEIYNLEILSWRDINSKDLLKEIEEKIKSVKGDFRQEIILSKWKETLNNTDFNFSIAKIRAEVSSGTYMRTLAYEWGKAMVIPALAFHIVRTKVGEYMV